MLWSAFYKQSHLILYCSCYRCRIHLQRLSWS